MPSNGAGPSPNEKQSPQCLRCRGLGWVSHRVPRDHPDFGQVFPCGCDSERRQREQRLWLLQWSNLDKLRPPKTLQSFTQRAGTEQALDAVKRFIAGRGATLLTLVGVPGSGKSHLLEGMGRLWLQEGYRVKYERCVDLLQRVRDTFGQNADERTTAVWDGYEMAGLLLLDDLGGLDSLTPWAIGRISALVDKRYQQALPTAIATNLKKQEVARRIDERLADRIWDMHTGKAEVAYLECSSYRTGR